MRNRMMMSPRVAPKVKLKTVFIYTAAGVALSGVIVSALFFYLNFGNVENTVANGLNFHSRQSGDWSIGSTWNGGSAPSTTNLNRDNVTINSNHTVMISGPLTINNQVSITINGNGKLVINGNLYVNNDLTLMINGELVVNGDIIANNGAQITVNGSGKVTTTGDVTLGNNTNLYVDGVVNVGGSLSFGNNAAFRGNGQVNVAESGCGQWTGNGTCRENIALPVELISFDVKADGSDVIVSWKTASEINNDFFTIEQSTDGINYTTVGTVEGNGTTKTVSSYEFVHDTPANGRSYYRLQQTDFDATTEIFNPKSVEIEVEESSTFNVYPNPLRGTTVNLMFSHPEAGVVEVIDGRGHRIASQELDGFDSEVALTLRDNVEPGMYYVNYKTAKSVKTVKLIKN